MLIRQSMVILKQEPIMNKVTDYSIIIFREDGTIDYETVHATDECFYVLFLNKNVDACDADDLSSGCNFSSVKNLIKANMCIGPDNNVLKCRWLCKPTLLLWTNERGHYNFYFEG